MIEIKADSNGKSTELTIAIGGNEKTIVAEAAHIILELPKRLRETDEAMFLRFMAMMVDLASDSDDEDEAPDKEVRS